MPTYDFIESLKRIDSCLEYNTSKEYKSEIPSTNGELIKDNVPVCATVMYIKLDTESKETNDIVYNSKCLASFFNEVSCICRSNECCRDIKIMTNSIMVIYSTPKKANVDSIIDDSARINSLSMVINKRNGNNFRISPTIGIDYGHVIMFPIQGNDIKDNVFWYGNPIIGVKKLVDENPSNKVYIKQIVWENIRMENQKLFKRPTIMFDYYIGNPINVIMNDWVITH